MNRHFVRIVVTVIGAQCLTSSAPAENICIAHQASQRGVLEAMRNAALSIDQCNFHEYWDAATCQNVRRDYRRIVETMTDPRRMCVAHAAGAWAIDFRLPQRQRGGTFTVGWALVRYAEHGSRVEAEPQVTQRALNPSAMIRETPGLSYFDQWVLALPRLVTFDWSRSGVPDVITLTDRASVDSFVDEESSERDWPSLLTTGRAWRMEAGAIVPMHEFSDETITGVRRVRGGWGLVARAGFVDAQPVEHLEKYIANHYPIIGPEFLFVRQDDRVVVDVTRTGVETFRNSCTRLEQTCRVARDDAASFAAGVCADAFGGVGAFKSRSCANLEGSAERLADARRRLTKLGVPGPRKQ